MEIPSRQSLSAFAARQPKFHFRLLSSLGLVVLASSFLSHDKRGLLYYDEPTALLADDLAMMPEYLTGGFGGGLAGARNAGGGRPNTLRRTIAPRGAVAPAAGLTGAGPAQAAPGGAFAPAGAESAPNLADVPGTALASGPAGGAGGLPAFGDGGGFAPTPIGFFPTGSNPGGSSSSSGGTSTGGTSTGGTSTGGTSSGATSSGGPTDPVVPAIPEPASWLMMIIAVFTLGSAIRRSNTDRAPLSAC